MPQNNKSKMTRSEDAEKLYQSTRSADPFPNISPALLNSADIHDYIETTGMVYPYDPEFMKSSSYEAQVGDRAFFWDHLGIKKIVELNKDSPLTLKPNSLVFIETKQEFRLPPYMAIRFNLRITLVHRGLLLGTGPLVDPGFCGKLLIPIHNLTNNTYSFKGDDKFIWVEFTKTSPNNGWDKGTDRIASQTGIYEEFPEDKKNRSPTIYFEKAYKGNPINNAVPAALEEAKKHSKKAMDRAKLISWGVSATILTFVFGLFPLLYNSWTLSTDVSKMISDFQKEYHDHFKPEKLIESKITAVDRKIINLDIIVKSIAEKSKNQGQFQNQLNALRQELRSFKAQATKSKSIPKKTIQRTP
jgi:deoxycytidine triphosphate deaminase